LVDLNQSPQKGILAIRAIRAVEHKVALLAVGETCNQVEAINAGADNYLDCNNLRDLSAALNRCVSVMNIIIIRKTGKEATERSIVAMEVFTTRKLLSTGRFDPANGREMPRWNRSASRSKGALLYGRRSRIR
jgi:hypothetical protein